MSNKPAAVDFILLLALALMFSSSFLFIKFAVQTITPLSLATGRMMIAAVILYIVMRMQGDKLPKDRRSWLFFVAVGIIGNVIPFSLISWAELTVDSSVAAILIGTVPLISFVMGHFITSDEKLTVTKSIGLIIGFCGIIVLIGPSALLDLGDNVISQLAVIAGGTGYVIASFTARAMPDMTPIVRATGVLIVASMISLTISLTFDQPWTLTPSLTSLGALVILGIFPTAIATVVLFVLIVRSGATFVSLNNYLNPVLGVLWGFLFMSESPDEKVFGGLILITLGVVFTQIKFPERSAKNSK
jgi:drug/metabolite transporter (DMT)-like permease